MFPRSSATALDCHSPQTCLHSAPDCHKVADFFFFCGVTRTLTKVNIKEAYSLVKLEY